MRPQYLLSRDKEGSSVTQGQDQETLEIENLIQDILKKVNIGEIILGDQDEVMIDAQNDKALGMQKALRDKIVAVCNKKIEAKGENVGLSFYAFFANKNENPELLMEAATWWILTHKLDHFEKAVKIKTLVLDL